ncbi:HET-domain-containing protein [Cadophora sp. DSE1049]|nr:HET-domain-containing protein [Cadophora sp. DSE1049]
MESTTTRHQHESFEDDRSIRLLYLQPGDFYDDINLKLEVVSLDDPPPYCALSYAWGPPPHETPVFCHGKELLVSESCVAALRRLRSTTDEKVLWIDAICIDQASLSERGHQVKLMCDVYLKAKRTWIWLGEGTRESDIMIDFLGRYCNVMDATRELSPEFRDELLLFQIEKLKAEERRLYGTESEALIESICRRPWFKRVWTVQEYILSRDSQIICGCKALPMSMLLKGAMSFICIRMMNGKSNYLPIMDSFIAYITQYSFIWDAIHANGKESVRLSDLLAQGRQLEASDPKDVVFGLHGMLEKFHIAIPPPDYSKSVGAIYTEATKAAIAHDSSLKVLLQCSRAEAKMQLPSWVPDWSSDEYHGLELSVGAEDFFGASGDSRPSFHFFDGGEKMHQTQRILCVKGVTIDSLKYCALQILSREQLWRKSGRGNLSDKEEMHRVNTALYEVMEAWMAVASKLLPYPTGEAFQQAFTRTVIQDSFRNPSWQKIFPSSNVVKGFSHWLLSCQLGSPQLDESISEIGNISSEAFKQVFLNEIGQADVDINEENKVKYVEWSLKRSSDAIMFQNQAHVATEETRFLTTEKGHMGQGMPDIQAGDEVLLVAGVSRPLIARKVGETYRLIGQAYVHGVMDGEKWPEDESELVDIMFE